MIDIVQGLFTFVMFLSFTVALLVATACLIRLSYVVVFKGRIEEDEERIGKP